MPFAIYGAVAVAIIALHSGEGNLMLGISAYGAVALGYLLLKLLASSFYRSYDGEAPTGTVAAVVPVYNEDPRIFRRCLLSLLRQTRMPDEIWVVDDGSSDRACYDLALGLLDGLRGVHVVRLSGNHGKRHAQAVAFGQSEADFYVTIDSDTELAPSAIENILKPFNDPRVQAVSGVARVANRDRNLLTRLIDLRYANAFLVERAAYSVLGGSVLCCTGVLSAYRGDLVRRHLRDYMRQTFLGVPVSYGDDRRLTNYALQSGRAVLQSTAIAYTMAPTSLGQFLRQQIRWNKSFFRETLWALRHLRPGRRWAWWLGLFEISTWLGLSATLISGFVIAPLLMGRLGSVYYPVYIVLLAYTRNARLLVAERSAASLQAYLLAPLYALLHLTLLTPLRFYSLVTIRDGRWGTRTRPPAGAVSLHRLSAPGRVEEP